MNRTVHRKGVMGTWIKAVIFDLDGLMVDSEPLSHQSWQEVLAGEGEALSPTEYRQLIGLDGMSAAAKVREIKDTSLTPQQLNQRHWEELKSRINGALDPAPGLEALVRELESRGLPLAVASNSPSDYVRKALESIGYLERLQAVVGLDQVDRGKPEPDLYLVAARRLGVEAERCLVLEDSPTGLEAARRAGMRCVISLHFVPGDPEYPGAYRICPSLEEIRSDLEALLGP